MIDEQTILQLEKEAGQRTGETWMSSDGIGLDAVSNKNMRIDFEF